jgi:uncharacterized membrane protein YdjX (TVP38/TMEM64 family)
MAKHLRKPIKYTLYIIMAWASVMTLFLLFQTVGAFLGELLMILRHGSQEELMAYLARRSQLGGLTILFFMSVLQVISIVLPGMLIQVSGALIFGWWKSFIVCWLGFVAGNALVFCVARITGKQLTEVLSSEKKNTWLVRQMNQHDPAFVTALACMIPGVPNGIIPYIAARTKLYLSEFVPAVAGSCWIQILLNCIAGHFLVRGQYAFTIFAIIVQIVLLLVIAGNREKILNSDRKS